MKTLDDADSRDGPGRPSLAPTLPGALPSPPPHRSHPLIRLVTKPVLLTLLASLGYGIAAATRLRPGLRAQINANVVVEVSTGDGVARHWIFEAYSHRARTRAGRVEQPDYRIYFESSGLALACLLSPRAVDAIMAAVQSNRARIDGNALTVLWFFGITRRVFAIGREPGIRTALPGAYLRHKPIGDGPDRVTIEPAVNELDPTYTRAWEARATQWAVRATTGEPVPGP